MEEKIVSKKGDPWEYKRSGDLFLARKKGSGKWITASGKAENAIKTKVFNITKETTTPKQVEVKKKSTAVTTTMPHTSVQKKAVNNDPPLEKPILENVVSKTSNLEKFLGLDTSFASDYYSKNKVDKDYIFVVDKPTGKLFKMNIANGSVEDHGDVGIGKIVGDRDVSGGRSTGSGTNMTQAGWVKINREQPYPQRSKDYGDEFNGFSAYTDGKWNEVPTGIHGSENETCGRVSHGCTRMPLDTEQTLKPYMDKNTLIYYTSDTPKNKGVLYKKGNNIASR